MVHTKIYFPVFTNNILSLLWSPVIYMLHIYILYTYILSCTPAASLWDSIQKGTYNSVLSGLIHCYRKANFSDTAQILFRLLSDYWKAACQGYRKTDVRLYTRKDYYMPYSTPRTDNLQKIYRSPTYTLRIIFRRSTETSTDHLQITYRSCTDYLQIIHRSFPLHDLDFQGRSIPDIAGWDPCILHDLPHVSRVQSELVTTEVKELDYLNENISVDDLSEECSF